MGSMNERFPREATSIEIWWLRSRIVDRKEPVCPFAGTFVMIVGALVTWAIYTQGQLLSWSSLILFCGVHKAYSQVDIGYYFHNESICVRISRAVFCKIDVISEFTVCAKDCGGIFFPEVERAIYGWWV